MGGKNPPPSRLPRRIPASAAWAESPREEPAPAEKASDEGEAGSESTQTEPEKETEVVLEVPGSNLGRDMEVENETGTSSGFPASQIPQSNVATHVSETQQSLGISPPSGEMETILSEGEEIEPSTPTQASPPTKKLNKGNEKLNSITAKTLAAIQAFEENKAADKANRNKKK